MSPVAGTDSGVPASVDELLHEKVERGVPQCEGLGENFIDVRKILCLLGLQVAEP